MKPFKIGHALADARAIADFMSADQKQANSKLISEAIRGVLEDGSTAVLATLVNKPPVS